MPDRPTYFYKYVSAEVARLVLQNGTLRWSTPGTLNDPYDMQFDLHVEVDPEALKARALARLWEAHYGDSAALPRNHYGILLHVVRNHLRPMAREHFDESFGPALDEGLARVKARLPETNAEVRAQLANGKVLCLTDTADSTAMWSYYAEQHRGAVLRFRQHQATSYLTVAHPVRYVDRLPRLIDMEYLLNALFEPLETNVSLVLSRMVFTKSLQFAHEREWRIYSGAGRRPDEPYECIPFAPEELDGVILGFRMPDAIRADLRALVAAQCPHSEVFVAHPASDEYRMQIRPIL